jgi:hypothetical protein
VTQIHDRYKPTGAMGYYIRDRNDSCMDVILAYPVGLEQNVWSLLENQRQAIQQFPEAEPNCARTLNLDELHLMQYLTNWDILDTYRNSLVLSRQEQCVFQTRIAQFGSTMRVVQDDPGYPY